MPGTRSRNIIAAHKQRRRGRRQRHRLLLVSSGALALAGSYALSLATFSGVDLAGAAVARAQSLADLLARRSPGARTAAHLIKTKHKHFAVLAERAAEMPPPESPVVEGLFAPAAAPMIAPPIVLADIGAPATGPTVFFPFFGGGIVLPCCSSSGPGGPPGQPPPTQPPPTQPPPTQPPPAVPEPSSWAMMIVGFALTGLMLRRRTQATSSPKAG